MRGTAVSKTEYTQPPGRNFRVSRKPMSIVGQRFGLWDSPNPKCNTQSLKENYSDSVSGMVSGECQSDRARVASSILM